ncbi:TraX family protein [Parasporobacterium paucivorans]|uniref:TraX protein n=1 Tax=Parasporobacterium paucivorans DSM 15970 TaxID=1122934 RepID=A0A1M6AJG5_9FIRM|nr:TraX family protein [Parasporobacterium paucivorans]SHI36612.1 TraX protein [Parasporobacterium paucivorans DSM 15970]
MEQFKKIHTTTFLLKIIAVASMLTDHVGAVLFPEFILLRIIGRLAFPIYCFLIVEGFFHTRNIKKYGARLFVFALASELPFDMAFHHSLMDFSGQNVFWTLFIGLSTIVFCARAKNYITEIIPLVLGMAAAMILRTDYSAAGILLIYVFYRFRHEKKVIVAAMLLINGLMFGGIQIFALISLVPIFLYNGKKGFDGGKYAFYLFYPVHLVILALLKIANLAFYL